jgi:hypothetical protein
VLSSTVGPLVLDAVGGTDSVVVVVTVILLSGSVAQIGVGANDIGVRANDIRVGGAGKKLISVLSRSEVTPLFLPKSIELTRIRCSWGH